MAGCVHRTCKFIECRSKAVERGFIGLNINLMWWSTHMARISSTDSATEMNR